MKLFLLSDLHLPVANNVRLLAFGQHWANHELTMAAQWDRKVDSEDIILVPGDISWANSIQRAKLDFDWLEARPGTKFISPGNHDRWWKDPLRLDQGLSPSLKPVFPRWQPFHGGVIASTVGCTAPGDRFYNQYDARRWEASYKELSDLLDALPKAIDAFRATFSILMIHYPPTFWDGKPNPLGELIVKAKPTLCVYGHIHQPEEWANGWHGAVESTTFVIGSADANNFSPVEIARLRPFKLAPSQKPCALL